MQGKKQKRGFGLIEVVFAVSIFLIVIGATLSLNSISYKNIFVNESRWKASLLAQNWIETQRNQRDNNIFEIRRGFPPGRLWDYNLPAAGWSTTKYYNNDMHETASASYFTATFDVPVHDPAGTVIVQARIRWAEKGRTPSFIECENSGWAAPGCFKNKAFLKKVVE